MTDNTQPEALRLAHIFDHPLPPEWPDMVAAAAELLRLRAENATLQSGYDAARLKIESLHARVQELELERERAVAAEREACAKLVQDMSTTGAGCVPESTASRYGRVSTPQLSAPVAHKERAMADYLNYRESSVL